MSANLAKSIAAYAVVRTTLGIAIIGGDLGLCHVAIKDLVELSYPKPPTLAIGS